VVPDGSAISTTGYLLPSFRLGGSVGTVPPEISPLIPAKTQIKIADLRLLSLNPAHERPSPRYFQLFVGDQAADKLNDL